MPRYPNEPKSDIVVVPAEFVQDPKSGEWVLTSLNTPRLSTRNIDVRRARKQLEKDLEAKLGKPVAIREKIKLPKHLADEVAAHVQKGQKLEAAMAAWREERMPLVNKLRLQRLQQQQIADLLGVSSAFLGQQLKLEQTLNTGNNNRNDR
jgi:hypothetical protein